MILLVVSAAAVFLLDQVTKRFIERRVANGPLHFTRFLTIRPISSARPRYRNRPLRYTMVAIWASAFLAAAALAAIGGGLTSSGALVAAGAALGGAAGNLRDVLEMRAVRDFIDLSFWPAFNVADVAIVGGLIVAFFPR